LLKLTAGNYTHGYMMAKSVGVEADTDVENARIHYRLRPVPSLSLGGLSCFLRSVEAISSVIVRP
jgi:hypothetical protein